MIVLDSSFLYALLDGADSRHAEAAAWYAGIDEELATSPLVIAEVDHLARRAGEVAAKAFRADLAAGAYAVPWRRATLTQSVEVAEGYHDLGVSLTDATLVVLAAELETIQVATFDERHFRAMRPLRSGPAFTLLPIDQAPVE